MKILAVLLSNYVGGPQIRVLSVAKELKKYDIDTVIVSPKGGGDFAQIVENEFFKSYQIVLIQPKHLTNLQSFITDVVWILTFPFSVLAIIRIITKEKIDIVHVQGLLNLQAPLAGILTNRKVVWHLISSLYPKVLVFSLLPVIMFISDHCIFVAKNLKHYYLNNNENRAFSCSVIYECVDVDKFDPNNVSKDEILKLKNEFNINYSDRVIGCIGNINPAKGYEYFIECANLIKRQLNCTKFLIVGAESDSQKRYYLRLKTLVSSLNLENDIIFTGKREDIPQLLSLFDVFLLTSINEGTPLVLLEAMAMETPVVVTDVGGISEQVENWVTGIIVPPRNPNAAAESVLYLLKNSVERVEMGVNGRKRVRDIFSLEQCVYRHKKLYEDLVVRSNAK